MVCVTQATAQLDAGNALLCLGQVIDRAKPKPQRQMRRGKDRPRNRGRLPAALGALIKIAGRHQTILLAAACRALKTMRPACREATLSINDFHSAGKRGAGR